MSIPYHNVMSRLHEQNISKLRKHDNVTFMIKLRVNALFIQDVDN